MPRTEDSSYRLLPSSSSKLEKDLARTMPFDAPLASLPALITSAKLTDLPASWLPWLIIEYGLAELAEFIDDPRELIEQGLLLRRLRGTPAAAKLALSWIGYPDAEIWEEPEQSLHAYEWQINLGRVPRDLSDVCRIAKLARIVQPVRSRLRRVYSGYDVRHFKLDSSGWGDLLSNYSGVWFDDKFQCSPKATELWASFSGQFNLGVVRDGGSVLARYERLNDYGIWVHDPLWPILDDDYEDSFYPTGGKAGMGMDRLSSGYALNRGSRWQTLNWTQSPDWRTVAVVGVAHASETANEGSLLTDEDGPELTDSGEPILVD